MEFPILLLSITTCCKICSKRVPIGISAAYHCYNNAALKKTLPLFQNAIAARQVQKLFALCTSTWLLRLRNKRKMFAGARGEGACLRFHCVLGLPRCPFRVSKTMAIPQLQGGENVVGDITSLTTRCSKLEQCFRPQSAPFPELRDENREGKWVMV